MIYFINLGTISTEFLKFFQEYFFINELPTNNSIEGGSPFKHSLAKSAEKNL